MFVYGDTRSTKKSESIRFRIFYPSRQRRLGMASRVSVYGIGRLWRCMAFCEADPFVGLIPCIPCGMIPYDTPCRFHAAASRGFHPRLRRDFSKAPALLFLFPKKVDKKRTSPLSPRIANATILTGHFISFVGQYVYTDIGYSYGDIVCSYVDLA